MKALIDINVSVQHAVGWTWVGSKLEPTNEIYPNSARVCEVTESEFPVAEPLFWADCSTDIVADQFYFDTVLNQFILIENAEAPVRSNAEIPVTET